MCSVPDTMVSQLTGNPVFVFRLVPYNNKVRMNRVHECTAYLFCRWNCPWNLSGFHRCQIEQRKPQTPDLWPEVQWYNMKLLTHLDRDKMAAIFFYSFPCLESVVLWFIFHWNLWIQRLAPHAGSNPTGSGQLYNGLVYLRISIRRSAAI